MRDRVMIGLACCYLIAACERIRDYERAVQWCDRLKAFCTRWGLRPLFAVCRTQYASVCMWRGAWEEAEQELTSASDELAACRPAMTGEGLARLGELRRRQGKLDEAMALFERCGSHPLASLGRASVNFDRGDFKTGADLAERHLRRLPVTNRTERAARPRGRRPLVRGGGLRWRTPRAGGLARARGDRERGADRSAARAGQARGGCWWRHALAIRNRRERFSKMRSICSRRAARRSRPAARGGAGGGDARARPRRRRRRRNAPLRLTTSTPLGAALELASARRRYWKRLHRSAPGSSGAGRARRS